MSQSLCSSISKPFSESKGCSTSPIHRPMARMTSQCWRMAQTYFKCEIKDQSEAESESKPMVGAGANGSRKQKLGIGSPIIITEAPKMIKTAASVPCLRVNADLVKPGDVGRIVARKPMDVWAIRLSIGTYLIDGKYFKPLELEE